MSKTKVVVIHGYGINIRGLGLEPEGDNAGFTAFDSLLSSAKAVIYRWDIPHHFNWLESLNPFSQIKVYYAEREKMSKDGLYKDLDRFLQFHQPTYLVGHSLGCEIIRRYLETYTPPKSVERIVTAQADMPAFFEIENRSLKKKLESGELQWENFWCWWDPALVVGSFLHLNLRAGLFGAHNTLIKNRFFPLYRGYNVHVSTMKSPEFIDYLFPDKDDWK